MAQQHLILKGATRPAMVLGIPMLPFILVGLASFLGILYSLLLSNQPLLSVAIAMASFVSMMWMRTISKTDPWRLNQRMQRFRLRQSVGDTLRWDGVSFAPYALKKRK